ncbi:MAG: ABC transporter ATP-binding protein [Proteobacteria bacterium]|nr:ABC transporter ATP-binding protein [Pseudomonadota bacterium]
MLIEATNLVKQYQDRLVVDGLNLELHSGEVLGLLGPNGAGKSTTVGMLTGMVIPTSGEIKICERSLTDDIREIRRLSSVVAQENNIEPDFTVKENLEIFCKYLNLSTKETATRIKEVAEQVGLTEYLNNSAEFLSGGTQRKLTLARALLNKPKLLFLDEPTTGLDPEARQEFWRLISELKESGVGILLTTHYMDEAERLCDRLILIKNGKAIDSGSPKELIAKLIGKEAIEVKGLSDTTVKEIVLEFKTWSRSLGKGAVIGTKDINQDLIWQKIKSHNPSQLTIREGNLQDVFLFLTGSSLE